MSDYKNVDAAEFCRLLDGKDFFLLDVRSSKQDHIPGTDAYVPSRDIAECLDKLPSDKSKKIIVYCGHGNSSLRVCKFLVDLGYTNVANLEGGASAYLEKRLEE